MGKNDSHRRKHRLLSHKQSHEDGTITPILQGNPLISTEDALWIDKEQDFLSLCKELKENGVFAFDTEFIGEDSYHPFICLIQVATAKTVALIDPFKIKNLTPLFELIVDPEIITILHSASQDLGPVYRTLGELPKGIFDTQIAAGLIGYPCPLSLTKCIETVLNHNVSGHFTFSQWDARPLSNRQKFYAADDVRYLFALYTSFKARLKALDREQWAKEEFDKFSCVTYYESNLHSIVKKICRSKSPQKKELQRIQSIAKIREKIAISRDLPTRAILPNECILALGKKPVETIEQLANMRGVPRNMANQYGERIIKAIQEASSQEPIKLRRTNPIEKDALIRQELDGAWSLFNAWCIGNKISSGLTTNRPVFTDWYLAIASGKKIPKSPLTSGWRKQIADDFASMVIGESKLIFCKNDVLTGTKLMP